MIFKHHSSKFENTAREVSEGAVSVAFSGQNICSIFMYVTMALLFCAWIYELHAFWRMIDVVGFHGTLRVINCFDVLALAFPIIYFGIVRILAHLLIPALTRLLLDAPAFHQEPQISAKSLAERDPASHIPLVPTSPPRFTVLA